MSFPSFPLRSGKDEGSDMAMNTRIDASVHAMVAGMQRTSTQECATGIEEMSAAVQRVSSDISR